MSGGVLRVGTTRAPSELSLHLSCECSKPVKGPRNPGFWCAPFVLFPVKRNHSGQSRKQMNRRKLRQQSLQTGRKMGCSSRYCLRDAGCLEKQEYGIAAPTRCVKVERRRKRSGDGHVFVVTPTLIGEPFRLGEKIVSPHIVDNRHSEQYE